MMEKNKKFIARLRSNFPLNRISAMIQITMFFHVGYLFMYAIPFTWTEFFLSILVLISSCLFFFVIGIIFEPSKDEEKIKEWEGIKEKVNRFSQCICLFYAIVGCFFAILFNSRERRI